MEWWPMGRSRREPAAAASPPATVPEPGRSRQGQAWRDLPAVQRTLAEPLRLVTGTDDFRDGLASFSNPSFLAPLSHQVDPYAGGLVEGLAAPRQPRTHRACPQLLLPHASTVSPPPRVQRTAGWSGPSDLATVGWELPDMLPADESTGSEPATQVGEPAGSGAPTSPPLSVPVQRSAATAPTSPPVTEPAPVRPGVGRAIGSVSTSDAPTATPADNSSPLTLTPPMVEPRLGAAPVVEPLLISRRYDPASTTVRQTPSSDAPWSGFAATIGSLAGPDEAAPSVASRPVGDGPGVVDSDGPTMGAVGGPARTSVLPTHTGHHTTGPLVQRTVTTTDSTRPHSEPAGNEHLRIEPVSPDVPTLGLQPGLGQQSVGSTSLTGRDSAPPSPVVQRMEFVGATEGTVAAGPARAASPTILRPSDPAPSAVIRTSPNPGRALSSAWSQVQRLVGLRPAPDGDTADAVQPTGPPIVPPVVHRLTSDIVPQQPSAGHAERSAPAVSPVGQSTLTLPNGPMVSTEAWTTPQTGSITLARTSGGAAAAPPALGPRMRVVTSAPSVQRSTRQGRGETAGPVSPAPPPPPALLVARQTGAESPPGSSRPGSGTSFASMFGSSETGSAADDGYTSVQLQSAGDPPAPTQVPSSGSTAATPESARATPAAPGTPSASELDELARRLYEPLSARLRAELWLDRERAGVMSDV